MLAAERHLERWMARNAAFGDEIAGRLRGFAADVDCSRRVAHWAYEQAVTAGGYGWVEGKVTERLLANCLAMLA